MAEMTGAESLVKTMLAQGVDLCFANPGTSEMHFVAALDSHPDMRCVLCLFEGGASGAADGYFRMSGRVGATMFHLAPGFSNAYANLHNARKAGSGILTVMGDHATRHLAHESPLKGDTAGISGSVCHWTRTAESAATVAQDGAAAISAARGRNGQLATLILPADTAWGPGLPAKTVPVSPQNRPREEEIAAAVAALKGPRAALLIGGSAAHGDGLRRAAGIAEAAGARLIAPLFVSRLERGAGTPPVEQLPYSGDMAADILRDLDTLVCLGAQPPVNFFAYPGKPSLPTAPGCRVMTLCDPQMDVEFTLAALVEALGAREPAEMRALSLPDAPNDGPLTGETACAVIARWIPEDAIVVNEAITSGRTFAAQSQDARRHDLLQGAMGGAIGGGLPVALGAAIACPDRPVLAMIGDGSAMYTLQVLWTMARERLDVTTVIFANRTYNILHQELAAMGAGTPRRNARRMFDLADPALDWVALARGHGVEATRVETVRALEAALAAAGDASGPTLIEVVL
ncbi:MAG: acetolactate synthase large subunit [Pseudomonadota bacterium]